jgi:hypothetical protein
MADIQGDCKYQSSCQVTLQPSASSGANENCLSLISHIAPEKQIYLYILRLPVLNFYVTGSTDSNDALNISLVTSSDEGIKILHSFNPKMTYSIFGDEESIFGYQGLKINLRYNACDMRPGLQIMYTKRFKTVGETSPTALKDILEPYLPKSKHGGIPSICSC